MVENVLSHRSKLDGESLSDIGILEHSHIPDVDARRSETVATHVGPRSQLGLDVLSSRIGSDIACHR